MSTGEDTGPAEDGRNALVAEYVLGLLDQSEHQRVGALIDADPQLRRERDFWISRFGALNDDYQEIPAPAHLREAIEARVFGETTRPQGMTALWTNLALWRSLAAGALAIAVIAIGVNLFAPRPSASILTTQLVAALEQEGSAVKFVALYDGAGNVRLTALSGEPVPNKDFELWAIQGGNAPVSMGIIPANARSAVSVPTVVMKGLGVGSVLAITLEPKGGSPSGAPTGPIVAKGAVTKI